MIKQIIKNNINKDKNYFFIQKELKISKQIIKKIFNSKKVFKRYKKLLKKIN